VHIRQENFAYPACLSENCNKKVTDMGDGTWRCEKCSINHDRPQYRYIMSADVSDHSGHIWVSCFDEQARLIVGRSADEMFKLQEKGDGSFEAAWEESLCRKMVFNCRAKMDTYGDQSRYVLVFLFLVIPVSLPSPLSCCVTATDNRVYRVRYQVMRARPMDYQSEGNKLAEMIKELGMEG